MNDISGPPTSLRASAAGRPALPKLARDLRADVCIVGAGIAGLTTARFAPDGRVLNGPARSPLAPAPEEP